MKIITFILKLLFFVYTLKWIGRIFARLWHLSKTGQQSVDANGTLDGAIFNAFLMAVICALPTLTIAYYIYAACNGLL